MKKKITVLGCGLVGRAIAIDLSKDYAVTAVDINETVLQQLGKSHPVHTLCTDVTQRGALKKAIQGADLVIGAVPGFMGFRVLQRVIEAGKNVVDISFFEEDPFELDALAKARNVTAVVDCGVAPGMSNMIVGYHNARMKVEKFECYVGGLPVERTLPYQYKAPFSPIDVIEEYTRPARLVENGKIITREALSEAEFLEFEGIGTLEAFNTDGLRTLLKTLHIPEMKEKTLRYPGHIQLMKIFRESGFFDKTPVDVKGTSVRPIDVSSKLLFSQWRLNPGDEDITVMRVVVEGKENGTHKRYTYHLFDRYDSETQTHSMARTTGYTCTAVANLVLEGLFSEKGISPPEVVAAGEGCFEFVLQYLKERDVNYAVVTENITV